MADLSLANGHWRYILQECGIDIKKGHQPCPLCGGKDRFRYTDVSGSGDYYCNQCGSGNGYQLLQRVTGWDNRKILDQVKRILSIPDTPREEVRKKDPRPALRDAWARRKPIQQVKSAYDYLMSRCGTIPNTLYAVPDLEYFHERRRSKYPAVIALVQDSQGAVTIHRTYTRDGRLADVESPRKCFPPVRHMSGSAIRLMPLDGDVLGIAEGIETAICASRKFGVPVWSTVSANGMETVILPEKVKELIVFGDNDESYRGQAAAYKLANRYAGKIRVSVEIPGYAGKDWADDV